MLTKTRCSQCKAFSDCPNETKFFVNYCGSQSHLFTEKIDKAISDCVAQRGLNYISFRSTEYHSAVMRDSRHLEVFVQ